MTLDEAIKHAEEMAEEQEELYGLCPVSDMQFCDGRSDCTTLKNGKDKGCLKCAKKYRQLAEWLKDYKRLLEQQSCDDCISRQAVLEIAKSSKSNWIDNSVLFKRVNELPPVTPKEKTGYWIPLGNYDDWGNENSYKCSECGELDDYPCEYCSNCGAKMIGEVSE